MAKIPSWGFVNTFFNAFMNFSLAIIERAHSEAIEGFPLQQSKTGNPRLLPVLVSAKTDP
jgi:hypothetical protein